MKATDIHIVYKLRQKETGLEYVGISTKRSFANRRSRHKRNFGDIEIVQIYCSLDRSHIDEMEEYFIEIYDTFKNGLNKTNNGKGIKGCDTRGYKFSEESKRKMSISKKKAIKEGVFKVPVPSKEVLRKVGEHNKKIRGGILQYHVSSYDYEFLYSHYLQYCKNIDMEFLTVDEAKNLKGYLFKTYESAFVYFMSKELNISVSSLMDILQYRSYVTMGGAKRKFTFDFVDELRYKYETQQPLPYDYELYVRNKYFENKKRAFSNKYKDFYGMSNVGIYELLVDKENKYERERLQATKASD